MASSRENYDAEGICWNRLRFRAEGVNFQRRDAARRETETWKYFLPYGYRCMVCLGEHRLA